MVIFTGLLFSGNIWFWTDDEGVRHYSNIQPPQGRDAKQLEESRQIQKRLRSKENKGYRFSVVKVFDGDTVKVTGLDLTFTIRMAGIDSPEIGYDGRPSQPYCRRAKNYLEGLLSGKKVEIKSHGTGGYNRQLGEVFLDGVNINLEMIKAGLAEVYQGRLPKGLDAKAYNDAQTKARKNRKGMWVQGRSYVSPKKWRKDHPRK